MWYFLRIIPEISTVLSTMSSHLIYYPVIFKNQIANKSISQRKEFSKIQSTPIYVGQVIIILIILTVYTKTSFKQNRHNGILEWLWYRNALVRVYPNKSIYLVSYYNNIIVFYSSWISFKRALVHQSVSFSPARKKIR